MAEQDFSTRLENLVKVRSLQPSDVIEDAIDGLSRTMHSHLNAGRNESNETDVQYNVLAESLHAALLTALRLRGYRPTGKEGHRAQLFDMAKDLLPLDDREAAFIKQIHQQRNAVLYDGRSHSGAKDLAKLVEVAEKMAAAVDRQFEDWKERETLR